MNYQNVHTAGGRHPVHFSSANIQHDDAGQPVTPMLASMLTETRRDFLRYLQIKLGNRDEAEDVLQDFYLRVIAKSGQIRDTRSTKAWLRSVLKSVLADYCRRQAAARRLQRQAEAEWRAVSALPEEEGVDRTDCGCFHKVLPSLKAEYSEVLRCVDLDGRSREVAARNLGITTGNVRVRLHRARQSLRRTLEHSCRECRDLGCFEGACAEAPPPRAALS